MVDFNEIAKKWQAKWEKAEIFKVVENPDKKKFYCLEMYPYPSSSTLHMGHVRNYCIGDAIARFRRMQGYNVLYPMGYDSFGLPAENAAIKFKSHPKIFIDQAIKIFIKQQKALGLSYDWSRMIMSHDPEYYKWDQWIFLKMFEKGLAYKKKATVNWCPECETVLANEQVHDGKCWRHSETEVEPKELEQWFFKITKYADELLEDIEELKGWEEDVKIMQRNWIGKSYGVEIFFKVSDTNEVIPTFTTRPDTAYSVTFIVVAPEHPKVLEWVRGMKYEKETLETIKKIKKQSIVERTTPEGKDKIGCFLGKYAINPVNGEKVPIYLANFVIMEYGTGIVMADAHDQRDFEFARKYKIPLKFVIRPENSNCIIIHGSPQQEKKEEPKGSERHWIPWIKNKLKEIGIPTFTPQMPVPWAPVYEDWKKEFEKLEVNENSILIGHSAGAAFLVRWLGEKQKKIKKLILVAPAKIPKNPDSRQKELYDFETNKNIKNLIEQITIFISNDEERNIEAAKNIYGKILGARIMELKNKGHFVFEDMNTDEFPELLNVILEVGNEAYTEDGILFNSGKFSGMNNREAIEPMSKWMEKNKYGKITVQYKLRDWLLSRQRFWGCPIPIIYCGKCGIVPDYNIPILLPEKVKFTGHGNPLESSKEFVNSNCPKCKGKAKRETDTMDTFVDSSWYFLRYCDANNDKKIFDSEKANYWMPIDIYIGGKEHATMHLIYFRFFTKFLRDLGLVKADEPAFNLFNQGMLHKNGFVMSKSRGNIVTQDEIEKKYGIDTARLFLMFISSPDKDMEWDDKAIEGSFRFLNKFYRTIFEKKKADEISKIEESKLNKMVMDFTKYIEEMQYNKALISIMQFTNFLAEQEQIAKESAEKLVKVLSVFTPHICEELWEKLGNKGFVSLEKWPSYDERRIDKEAEALEEALESTKKDIHSVIELAKIENPRKITIFVADEWKYELTRKLKEEMEKTRNVGEIMKKFSKEFGSYMREISKIVPRMVKDETKLPKIVVDRKKELDALKASADELKEEFNCDVEVIEEKDSKEAKAKNAMPGKVAILVE